MKIAARTDKGVVRDNNQDSYTACELEGGAVLAIVCDGMGGAAEGALASSEAVRLIKERIAERFLSDMSDLSIKSLLISAIENANKHIYNLSKTDESYEGMGTTAVAVIIANSYVYIAHAGDSRAYKISDEKLIQLTRDHSIVQRMIENGEITAEEATDHPSKHIITRALGVDDEIKTDFCQEMFDDGEILILCSDGLTNYSKPDDILRLTSDGCYYKYADRLVNLANQNGGGDNITVVAVAY
ncbi:MAG: Stp1/IreP family PP2C-type Ser/Thr phosphatase [Clostridia bacterium]|nr:Stp1/IreP family PP2C-type Ser/Thr phosphatase [Clostridia bacterium]